MKDQNLNDVELDDYFACLKTIQVEVPEDLETRIQQRVEKAVAKKRRKKLYIAACIILLIFSMPGILLIPRFHVYAQNIPILNIAARWLYGDNGLKEAAQNGYFVQEPLVVERDGVSLQVKDFSFDEERLTLTVTAGGLKLDEIRQKNTDAVINMRFPELTGYYKDIVPKTRTGERIKDKQQLSLTQELTFDEGMVKQFLKDKNPDSIKVDIRIFITPRNGSGIKSNTNSLYPETIKLGVITVPFNRKDFLESKHFSLNGRLKSEHIETDFTELIVSPTKMRVVTETKMKKGLEFEGFLNPCIKDNTNQLYDYDKNHLSERRNLQNGIFFIGGDLLKEGRGELLFIPSLYYADIPEELYFQYDGYFISENKGREINVKLSSKYAAAYKYMGKDIVIRQAFYEDGMLKLIVFLPKEFYSVDIIDKDPQQEDSYTNREFLSNNSEGQLMRFEIFTSKKPEYDLMLEHPLYLISETGKVEIRLEE